MTLSRFIRALGWPVLLALAAVVSPAVKAVTGGSTSDPGTAPWDYVGTVAEASGVFLGEYAGADWVMTAAHVNAGTFSLAGSTYAMVANSAITLKTSATQFADLTIFEIATAPSLANLTLSPYLDLSGVAVELVGNGNGKSWGLNTVAGYATYTLGTTPAGGPGIVTLQSGGAQAVGGDSGGGLFIDVAGTWELAGIMSGVGDLMNDTSDLGQGTISVDLAAYHSQLLADLNGVHAVPEPAATALVCSLAALGLWGLRRSRASGANA